MVIDWVAFHRFAEKCNFNRETGCVDWTGGRSRGGGYLSQGYYGAFWYEGRRWAAHRWAAHFIHDLNIDNLTVEHECGNTLCVHHLSTLTTSENSRMRWVRVKSKRTVITDLPFWLPPEKLLVLD